MEKGDRGTNYNPSLWYLDGIAHDFTEFAQKHPGGQYALYLGQGRECMPMLYSYHNDVDKVKDFAKKYICPPELQLKNLDGNF